MPAITIKGRPKRPFEIGDFIEVIPGMADGKLQYGKHYVVEDIMWSDWRQEWKIAPTGLGFWRSSRFRLAIPIKPITPDKIVTEGKTLKQVLEWYEKLESLGLIIHQDGNI